LRIRSSKKFIKRGSAFSRNTVDRTDTPNIFGKSRSSSRIALLAASRDHRSRRIAKLRNGYGAFGADAFVRISYATSMERLREGVRRMDAALRRLPA
jgi:hypothetical protein